MADDSARPAAAGDLLRVYLEEIGRDELLSTEEEVALAQAMEAGRAAEERLTTAPEVSAEERGQLEDMVAAGHGPGRGSSTRTSAWSSRSPARTSTWGSPCSTSCRTGTWA